MSGAEHRPIVATEKHRQAISHLNRQDDPAFRGDGGICDRARRVNRAAILRRFFKTDDLDAMNLIEPVWFSRQIQRSTHAFSIALHGQKIIAHMYTEVE
jgi:hypothetical protein